MHRRRHRGHCRQSPPGQGLPHAGPGLLPINRFRKRPSPISTRQSARIPSMARAYYNRGRPLLQAQCGNWMRPSRTSRRRAVAAERRQVRFTTCLYQIYQQKGDPILAKYLKQVAGKRDEAGRTRTRRLGRRRDSSAKPKKARGTPRMPDSDLDPWRKPRRTSRRSSTRPRRRTGPRVVPPNRRICRSSGCSREMPPKGGTPGFATINLCGPTPADGTCGARPSAAWDRRAYRSAWWRCWRGPASLAPAAGRRRRRACAWRSCAAWCGDRSPAARRRGGRSVSSVPRSARAAGGGRDRRAGPTPAAAKPAPPAGRARAPDTPARPRRPWPPSGTIRCLSPLPRQMQ